MDPKLVLGNSRSAAAACRIPLSEGRKIFEYQTEADLLSEPGT